MENPKPENLDVLRQRGFRPQVVGCFINNKRLLFVYAKKHNLWQLPQGGIENNETYDQALEREMTEELGKTFMQHAPAEHTFVGTYKIAFPKEHHNSRELKTKDGDIVRMKGKKYFAFAIVTPDTELVPEEGEFDDYRWANVSEALKLAKTIYQPQKQRKTESIVRALKDRGFL